ncbi:hypothetical protein FOPE_03798 [Fonsecaea pedrosoi]|nr:hypothetical protein FOPE_03798 [Fonsecaea pedrosoi]
MPCCYPEIQHKPGPKLGSHSSKHRKRVCWHLGDHSPGSQEDIRETEDSNSVKRKKERQRRNLSVCRDSTSTTSDTSSPESTTAQSWVFHHFHEDQSYSISPLTTSDNAIPSESLSVYTWPAQDNTSYVCRILCISKDMLFKL